MKAYEATFHYGEGENSYLSKIYHFDEKEDEIDLIDSIWQNVKEQGEIIVQDLMRTYFLPYEKILFITLEPSSDG